MSESFAPPENQLRLAIGQPIAYGGGKWRGGGLPAADLSAQTTPPEILHDAAVDPGGALLPTTDHAERSPLHAVPLGSSSALLGEWLLEVLVKSAWIAGNPDFHLCGPALSPAQNQILNILGHDHYIALTAPTRFSRLARFEFVRRPSDNIKAPACVLRGDASSSGAGVAILPQHATERFTLANRASLAAWARAKRFSLLEPEAMSFDELRAILAGAGTIILADPRQSGLLALSQPVTKVVEIAPAGWRGTTCRYLCQLFDLAWAPCDAGPLSYKLLTALPFGTRVPLAYEVPIGDLAKRLQTL